MLVLDQENRHNLGGQAWWSLGGLFFVDSPEQRRLGIKDSPELAWPTGRGPRSSTGSATGTDRPGLWNSFLHAPTTAPVIQQRLGLAPTPMADGVARTVAWWREQERAAA